MNKKRLVIGALLAGSIASGVALVGGEEAKAVDAAPAALPEVPVEEIAARELAETVEINGVLAAVEDVEIRPRVGGYLDSVALPEGGLVTKGQLLFQLDDKPFRAALARAQADLARARHRLSLANRKLERAEPLLAEQVIAPATHDDIVAERGEAAAAVEAARAAVQSAELELGYTRIVSPIDGRVGQALVRPGNLVAGGNTVLTTVVSVDPIHVVFDVDEPTYRQLTGGREVAGAPATQVQVALGDEPPRTGNLDFLGNRIDPSTGTARVRAVLPNGDGRLSPGLFARVMLPTSTPAPVPVVSEKAIGTDQGGRFVLVVDGENTVRYRPVQFGGRADGMRIVREGLQPGDKVVVGGMVRPGMKVQPKGAEQAAGGAR